MLALNEKVRTVVLFRPNLLINGKADEIVAKFGESYLEVKAQKQVYLTRDDVDNLCRGLVAEQRAAAVEAWTKGLSRILVVEHLDNDVIERTKGVVKKLEVEYGEGSIYCSGSRWASMRDMEFFFPHLDDTPVERTLALIKPDGAAKGGLLAAIEEKLHTAGLLVVGRRTAMLSEEQAAILCKEHQGTDLHKASMANLTSEPAAVALCLEGPGAIGKWQLLCGPSDPAECKEVVPTALRARWGEDKNQNAVHASATMAAAELELKAVFPQGALQMQRALCIVKPHAMGNMLQIRTAIQDAGFTILKEKRAEISESRARELYADQKKEEHFEALVQAACGGPSALLVLCRLEAVEVLRQLIGPDDLDEAKASRPRSLRARFGDAGQQNAVHGSATAKQAGWEVRFFFPELGMDPAPDTEQVKDFMFRKSAKESMNLKTVSPSDSAADYINDPTLQQLISSGMLDLCKHRPKGLQAVSHFKDWLMQNNPNSKERAREENILKFDPKDRTQRFVEHGVTEDGLPFSVEAPPAPPPKKIIDVNVVEESDGHRHCEFASPPYVAFIIGSGGHEHCPRLAEELNFVHLDAFGLLQAEVAACSRLGAEAQMSINKGQVVADEVILEILKKAMLKHADTNRFLLEGFPKSAEQAKKFEQTVATAAFVVSLGAAAEKVGADVAEVVSYYTPIGKLRTVDTSKEAEAVYNDIKSFFRCRIVYLIGPPGLPVPKVAHHLEEKYGYQCIDVLALLRGFAESSEREAATVKHALSKGKAIDASVVCPLVLSEVYRGRALGVTNFVICDFPQSLKQAEFLEYKVPCVSKPMLLNFSRADAEDLISLSAGGADAMMRADVFFSEERQAMFRGLPNLVTVPCSLAEMEKAKPGRGPSTSAGLEADIVDAVWQKVRAKLRPRLVLSLGMPNSGTNTLAAMLSRLTPNTYAVDCEMLLSQEIERKTEVGLMLASLKAQGQAPSLAVTLELVKDVANLTCSDCIVVEKCPVSREDLAMVSQEFTVERACYIEGDEPALAQWRSAFLGKKTEDEAMIKAWADEKRRLDGVVTHFSRLGRLDVLPVSAKPGEDELTGLLSQAGMPSFILVIGLSTAITPKFAAQLASQLNVALPLHLPSGGASTNDTMAKLQRHAESSSAALVILDRCAQSEEQAAEFVAHFGVPQLIVNVSAAPEFIDEEFKAAHEEMDEEATAAAIGAERDAYEGAVKVFKDTCGSAMMTIELASLKAPVAEEPAKAVEEMCAKVKTSLVPRAYAVVAPAGKSGDFGTVAADIISTTARQGAKPMKFTVVDLGELFKVGGHSAESEEALHRASFAAPAPDCLPSDLWVKLVSEAFASSANPMGPFLVTGFPTVSAVAEGPSIRDQFFMLESIASLGGILQVRVSDELFARACSSVPADLESHRLFEISVLDQISKQYDKTKCCDCFLNQKSDGLRAAAKASEAFLSFLESPSE